MLARQEERFPGLCGLDNGIRGFPLLGFGQVTYVSGMDYKRRFMIERVDLVHCCLQRAEHIVVGLFFEPDMAIADLHEMETRSRAGLRRLQCARSGDAAGESIEHACSSPCHALEKSAAVYSVFVHC